MPDPAAIEDFVASSEYLELTAVPETARRAVAERLLDSLAELETPVPKLCAYDAHGWLLHALPDHFETRDALAPHIAPVLSAWLDFAGRASGVKLATLRKACDELLPELEHALAHGGHHHGHDDGEPPQPFVRESPKVGRNDPCPCGSGKKFKKCHGA